MTGQYKLAGQRLLRSEMPEHIVEHERAARRRLWRETASARRANPEKLAHDNAIRAATKREGRRDAVRWIGYKLSALKAKCKAAGIPCTITRADIVLPVRCPVLGIVLILGAPKNHPQLPSVDRVRPELGYVPGNVRVISRRANTLKNDSTDPDELRAVADYIERELAR